MNAKRPAKARRKGTPGRKYPKRSATELRIPTSSTRQDVVWRVRAMMLLAIQELERYDLDATERVLWNALEAIEAAS